MQEMIWMLEKLGSLERLGKQEMHERLLKFMKLVDEQGEADMLKNAIVIDQDFSEMFKKQKFSL